MNEFIRTIAGPARAEVPRIKGSRFIGDALPITSDEDARERLAEIRAREPAATHHCWALRQGPSDDHFRTSDDGEPSGTAGLPILRQIDGRGLADILVVVTRYYGGTKLGSGGLIRAYGDAAAAVLDEAVITERVIRVPLRLRFGYEDTSPVMQTLHRFDAVTAEEHYTAKTELLVLVRRSEAEALVQAFTDALGGRGEVVAEVPS